jgi:hypothetical protein
MEATINTKKNKRKFKQTKQLIRLAINDGLNQSDIAKTCRSHQSIVSDWYKGIKQGTEAQLKPLLEKYGYKLRRNSFRVYWSIDPGNKGKSFYKVEGKAVFSQVFYECRGVGFKRTPILKLVVHHQGNNEFRLIYQTRHTFQSSDEKTESMIEDVAWNSSVSDKYELPDLLNVLDKYVENTSSTVQNDLEKLPFIVRQALLNHGFDIDGVVEYPAIW